MLDKPISSARLVLGMQFELFLRHVVGRKPLHGLYETVVYTCIS
jgi:hypothetical protein